MTYQEENNILYNYFLDKYFYQDWKQGKKEIELIFSPICNLNCKYCYLDKGHSKIFSINNFNEEKSIENAILICKWLSKNKYRIKLNIFSGELFAQSSGFRLLNKIYDYYETVPEENRILAVCVPTNATFISSPKLLAQVEELIQRGVDTGIPLKLSLSVDGKISDDINRINNNSQIFRDYDKIFQFAKKYGFYFHPMIYSNGIDKQKENFDWFIEQLQKYDLPLKTLSYLQIRNKEWNKEQNKELYDFIKYMIKTTSETAGDDFFEFIRTEGFNILAWLFGGNENKYTCSIQSALPIYLNDMRVFPCHRLMYPNLEIGNFMPDEKEILKFQTKNASIGIGIYGSGFKTNPSCYNCDINELCLGGCLGSQYETMHIMTMPIPTVCLNYIYLFKALVDGYDEIGVLEKIKVYLSEEKREQVEKLRSFNINDLQ